MMQYTFIKFVCVGFINTCIGLSVMFICLKLLHWNYWMSTLSGNGVTAVISFYLNKRFTFQSKVPVVQGFFRFLFVLLTCYIISYKIGLDLVEVTFDGMVALHPYKKEFAIIVGSAIYSLLNYFGQRFIVFKWLEPKDFKG